MVEHHLDKGKSNGRERLLKAAKTLAQHCPFDEITIDEIVKKAELSRPALYYHFAGGKEELRAELLRNGLIKAPRTHDIHQAILEAALRVFVRSGISDAMLDEIAAEAGVSRGAVCWHFRHKEDLLSHPSRSGPTHRRQDCKRSTAMRASLARRAYTPGSFYAALRHNTDQAGKRADHRSVGTPPGTVACANIP